MNYRLSTLKNKLRLLTVTIPSLESACVTFWVKAGSRYEEKKIAGVSHFLEHMAFKGGAKFKTALEVSQALDGLGAEYNAATSKEWTAFYIKASLTNLEGAFEVLSDILLSPTLPDSEIEKERKVILEEIAMEEDHPAEKVGTVFTELLFPDHPLGVDIAGTPESVRAIQKSDILNYRNRYYVTENCLLTVSGGVEPRGVLKMAQKYFAGLSRGSVESPIPFNENQKSPRSKFIKKKTEQTHIVFGYRGVSSGDPKRYAQTLLAVILGGGMSSRLFTEVREKRGLAYSIGTSASNYLDTGIFATYAGVDPKNARETIKIIKFEHEAVVSGKRVSSHELKKAKDYVKGRVALSLEDTSSVNGFFAKRALFLPKVETPQEYFERIDVVTLEELERVAKDLFNPQKAHLAVIGPLRS